MSRDERTLRVDDTETVVAVSRPVVPIDISTLTPGTVLARRYRIVSLLGQGGMGAVYRADDLRLGLPVALKFLTREANNPRTLERLYAEVRLGRQITHPNVCRIFDLVETEDARFLSMEYVDGEDLASLLRRVGRLAPERALRIAREICAGVHAAHAKGIVHRDLKPANVMIDGSGAARVTDFGLAIAADQPGEAMVAGTPQYMAPEQFSGEPGVRSDVYSLGLVLYELFSGVRLFEKSDLAALVAEHEREKRPLSALVREVGPQVDAAVMACLAEDPALRPPDALAVMRLLPGGDRLLPGIDSHQTPAPEVVAAAQVRGDLRVSVACSLLIWCLVGIAASIAVAPRLTLVGGGLPHPPEVLRDRARQLIAATGRSSAPYEWMSFGINYRAMSYERERGRPVPLDTVVFWYRQNPTPIAPFGLGTPITPGNPPIDQPGMVQVSLTAEGKLTEFRAVPADRFDGTIAPKPDWQPFLAAAGMSGATEVRPVWTPALASDQRWAWEKRSGGRLFRCEAAAMNGQPVWFRNVPEWMEPRQIRRQSTSSPWFYVLDFLFFTLLLPGAWLARRNLRSGRGDRAGALKLAVVIGTMRFVATAVRIPHTTLLGDLWRVAESLAWALFYALLFWLAYLAIEPSLRKRAPAMLIGWNRLLLGRARDPFVGMEILVGCAVAVFEVALQILIQYLFDTARPSGAGNVFTLAHGSRVISLLLNTTITAGLYAFGTLLAVSILRALLRRALIADAVWVAIVTFGWTAWSQWSAAPALVLADALHSACVAIAGLVLLRRVGFLSLFASFEVMHLLAAFPMTLETTAWYFWQTMLVLGIVVGMAAFAFHSALGGKPVIGKPFALE